MLKRFSAVSRWGLFSLTSPLFLLALGVPMCSAAWVDPLSPASETSSGPQNPAELEAFLDGLFGGLLPERHIPGAVVLVVKDSAVVFTKGYGFADLETKRSIDPETTLFRVGSVSKLFTATAVMQLVEKGQLDLHADVNHYLDRFSLKDGFGEPVTLAHLLTHTGGFDDSFLGMSQSLDREPVPLGQHLVSHMPPRAMPPGDLISYSNYGFALAGYIVERVSGQPFADYVKEHILTPLGMHRSGFGPPTPLPSEFAVPYDYKDGKYLPLGYDRLLVGPAGDLYTSAADMARFMLAHLQRGHLGSVRILGEDTIRLMQSQQFTHHPKLQGWCYGFEEDQKNSIRIIWHAGSWRGFGTYLVLVPEANLGLFVSTNRDYDPRFATFIDRFFDHYFPRAQALSRRQPPENFTSRAQLFTGSYIPNRHVRGDLTKMGLFFQEVTVTADDRALTVQFPTSPASPDPLRLVEVEPALFEVVDKGHFASFRMDQGGRVTQLFLDGLALDKLAWYKSPRVHMLTSWFFGLLFAGTVLGWTLSVIVHRLAGEPGSRVPRSARRLGFVVAFLNWVFLGWLSIAFSTISPWVLAEGVPTSVSVFCAIPLVSIPLSLGLPYFLFRAFREPGWSPLARLHYLFLTLAAFLFAGWTWYWKLLGVGF